jgi:hypothetical protein
VQTPAGEPIETQEVSYLQCFVCSLYIPVLKVILPYNHVSFFLNSVKALKTTILLNYFVFDLEVFGVADWKEASAYRKYLPLWKCLLNLICSLFVRDLVLIINLLDLITKRELTAKKSVTDG